VLSFLLFFILKNVDFKQNMGFKGSFNRNYLRMKINSFCEFSEYYPAVFSSGLISINENFHQNF